MRTYWRFIWLLLITSLLLPIWASNTAMAGPSMRGRAAVLLDASSGKVLVDQHAGVKNYPASTTKLLTALVAVEHGRLDQIITVSSAAAHQPADSTLCYIRSGERLTLEQLLHGMLLVSGNDCAEAVAEGVAGGNLQQFITWMNDAARKAGATASHFANPHGLHSPDHYTTALDLAKIAEAALSNPAVLKIASAADFTIAGDPPRVYHNHNEMLRIYDGTVGGKTGFTEEAGHTLITATRRGGRMLVGVVMGESSRETLISDMTTLLNYGYESSGPKVAVTKGATVGHVRVLGGDRNAIAAVAKSALIVPDAQGSGSSLRLVPRLSGPVEAPVTPGQPLGTLEVRDGERLVGTVAVIAQGQVASRGPVAGISLRHVSVWMKDTRVRLSLAAAASMAFLHTIKRRDSSRPRRRRKRRTQYLA